MNMLMIKSTARGCLVLKSEVDSDFDINKLL